MNPEPAFDFANILFGGPCNMRCPYCIGRQIDPALTPDNLAEFPPRNLNVLLALVRRHNIANITLTGATTDPQLYRHEARLIRYLRQAAPQAQISLHTNGLLALKKMDVFNRYHRVTVSFSSFDPAIHYAITGVPKMANLPEILRQAAVPVKISAIVNRHTAGQLEPFLARCAELGVRRVALRRLFGDSRRWPVLPGLRPARAYRRNPVYNVLGMEVTVWNFDHTSSRALNLFSDGTITRHYLLTGSNEQLRATSYEIPPHSPNSTNSTHSPNSPNPQ